MGLLWLENRLHSQLCSVWWKEGWDTSANGLDYDDVIKLAGPFLDQGDWIYMNSYYTSP